MFFSYFLHDKQSSNLELITPLKKVKTTKHKGREDENGGNTNSQKFRGIEGEKSPMRIVGPSNG